MTVLARAGILMSFSPSCLLKGSFVTGRIGGTLSDYFVQDGQRPYAMQWLGPLFPTTRLRDSLVARASLARLRCGDGWEAPDTTHRQLRLLARLSAASVYDADDIAVTKSTAVYYSPDDSVSIPDYGYRLSDQCQPYGGWQAVREACGACPAMCSWMEEKESLAVTAILGFGSKGSLNTQCEKRPKRSNCRNGSTSYFLRRSSFGPAFG